MSGSTKLHNSKDNQSFFLIKPDGINNFAMLEELENQLKLSELKIVDSFKVILKSKDIKLLWPPCPISSLLLSNYLSGHEMKVLMLSGEAAVLKSKNIKYYIRSKYSLGAFANCLHTPSTVKEYEFQIEILLQISGRITSGTLSPYKVLFEERAGVWGRLAKLGNERLCGLAEKVWDIGNSNGWGNMYTFEVPKGESYVKLNNDNVNSISYVTSCLYEFFTDWEPERALMTVIEVDRKGSLVLGSGKKHEMLSIKNKLCELGLNAEVI